MIVQIMEGNSNGQTSENKFKFRQHTHGTNSENTPREHSENKQRKHIKTTRREHPASTLRETPEENQLNIQQGHYEALLRFYSL